MPECNLRGPIQLIGPLRLHTPKDQNVTNGFIIIFNYQNLLLQCDCKGLRLCVHDNGTNIL